MERTEWNGEGVRGSQDRIQALEPGPGFVSEEFAEKDSGFVREGFCKNLTCKYRPFVMFSEKNMQLRGRTGEHKNFRNLAFVLPTFTNFTNLPENVFFTDDVLPQRIGSAVIHIGICAFLNLPAEFSWKNQTETELFFPQWICRKCCKLQWECQFTTFLTLPSRVVKKRRHRSVGIWICILGPSRIHGEIF